MRIEAAEANAICRDRMESGMSAMRVLGYNAVAFLEPIFAIAIPYKGKTYEYYVNAYAKYCFDGEMKLSSIYDFPKSKAKVAEMKSSLRHGKLLNWGIKSSLLILPIIAILVSVLIQTRQEGNPGVIAFTAVFSLPPLIAFFLLHFNTGELKDRNSIGWVISHNKVKTILYVVFVLIALFAIVFGAAAN